VRSPERARRASGTASRRSVVTRAPAFLGMREGATTQQASSGVVRERESQSPQGPAAETKTRGVAVDGLLGRRGARSHGRVPMVPRERTAAPCSGATEATAMAAWWTSIPTESVRDCCRVDRRACGVEGATSGGAELMSAHPRAIGGQLPAIGSHYVSAFVQSEVFC
jgi:hypothetical protein